MDKKRKCMVCGTTLANLNKGDTCFRHTPGAIIKMKIPVTLCTSFRAEVQREMEAPPVRPLPGDLSYNDLAFTEDIEGVVDENGDIVPVNWEQDNFNLD